MKTILRSLAVAAVITGTATSGALAAPVANIAPSAPSLVQNVYWGWYHHRRVWVPTHYYRPWHHHYYYR